MFMENSFNHTHESLTPFAAPHPTISVTPQVGATFMRSPPCPPSTYESHDHFSLLSVQGNEEGIVHDVIVGQEMGVGQDGLHQHHLGVRPHVHRRVVDNWGRGEKKYGRVKPRSHLH